MTIFAAETTKDQTYDDEKAIYDNRASGCGRQRNGTEEVS